MLRILIFMVAICAAGVAAWLTLGMQINEAPAAYVVEPAAPIPTQEILVAAGEIGPGATLKNGDMRWQEWPEAAVSAGFIRRSETPEALDSFAGHIVRSRLIPGEPIRPERLMEAGSGFLAANLPSGKRAIAVRISAENTAGGFILPNDRVDVLQTVKQGDGGLSNVSRTILRNVQVLAIDQTASETDTGSVIGKTATLELDPTQAEIVVAAEASGLLSLALRSVADSAELPAVDERLPRTLRIFRAGRSELVQAH